MATEIVMNIVTYHITLDMQLGAENSGTTEEHSGFRGAMNLSNGLEDHVPVWTTEVGGSSQTGDGILFSICVINHDVGCIVGLDLCSEVLGAVSYDTRMEYECGDLLCESRYDHQDLVPR
jgi:hypothetical protein